MLLMSSIRVMVAAHVQEPGVQLVQVIRQGAIFQQRLDVILLVLMAYVVGQMVLVVVAGLRPLVIVFRPLASQIWGPVAVADLLFAAEQKRLSQQLKKKLFMI